jgi:hypothetical protein
MFANPSSPREGGLLPRYAGVGLGRGASRATRMPTPTRMGRVDPGDFAGTAGAGATYSISGRVVDGSGNPIAGVVISDNAGHTAVTGSDGRYTLSGLAAGTYTLTPSKSGYAFSPASRAVTVPPDATGVDFVGTSQAFDTCEAPPVSKMEVWMRDSPYRGIGIYIGGSSRSCPQRRLNRDWVAQVSGQGLVLPSDLGWAAGAVHPLSQSI